MRDTFQVDGSKVIFDDIESAVAYATERVKAKRITPAGVLIYNLKWMTVAGVVTDDANGITVQPLAGWPEEVKTQHKEKHTILQAGKTMQILADLFEAVYPETDE